MVNFYGLNSVGIVAALPGLMIFHGLAAATLSTSAFLTVFPILAVAFDVEVFNALAVSFLVDLVNGLVLFLRYGKYIDRKTPVFLFSLMCAGVTALAACFVGISLIENNEQFWKQGAGYLDFVFAIGFFFRARKIRNKQKINKLLHENKPQLGEGWALISVLDEDEHSLIERRNSRISLRRRSTINSNNFSTLERRLFRNFTTHGYYGGKNRAQDADLENGSQHSASNNKNNNYNSDDFNDFNIRRDNSQFHSVVSEDKGDEQQDEDNEIAAQNGQQKYTVNRNYYVHNPKKDSDKLYRQTNSLQEDHSEENNGKVQIRRLNSEQNVTSSNYGNFAVKKGKGPRKYPSNAETKVYNVTEMSDARMLQKRAETFNSGLASKNFQSLENYNKQFSSLSDSKMASPNTPKHLHPDLEAKKAVFAMATSNSNNTYNNDTTDESSNDMKPDLKAGPTLNSEEEKKNNIIAKFKNDQQFKETSKLFKMEQFCKDDNPELPDCCTSDHKWLFPLIVGVIISALCGIIGFGSGNIIAIIWMVNFQWNIIPATAVGSMFSACVMTAVFISFAAFNVIEFENIYGILLLGLPCDIISVSLASYFAQRLLEEVLSAGIGLIFLAIGVGVTVLQFTV